MNGQAAEDLWHLTIDDLLATPADAPRLGGPGPFVINLSASTAPICLPAGGVPGFEHLNLYELRRNEDGRIRFRLRLGPIDSELEADAILAGVRELYPSAFTTNAAEDDQKVFQREAARAADAEDKAASVAPNGVAVGANGVTVAANGVTVAANGVTVAASGVAVAAKATAAAAAPILESLIAPDPPPHTDVEIKGEVEADIDLAPAPPLVEASAEFVIDFDALLPPLDQPAAATAPATQFVEPALDPNAATDQVAVLTLSQDSSIEVTLEGAAESAVAAVDAGIATTTPAAVPPKDAAPGISAPATPRTAARIDDEIDDDGVDELDLESIVARNNAMVEALQARTGSAAPIELELQAEQIAAQMAESLPVPLVARTVILESLGQAEALSPVPAAAVLAAIATAPTATVESNVAPIPAMVPTDLAADIEADVDDFTSTFVGAEAEQTVDEVGDIALEVAGLALSSVPPAPETHEVVVEPEPCLLVDAVELSAHGAPVVAIDANEPADTEADAVTATAATARERSPAAAAAGAGELSLIDEQDRQVEPSAESVEASDAPTEDEALELVEVVASRQIEPGVEDAAPESPVAVVAVAARPVEILCDPIPEMDSTQTIRELTPLELADDHGSQFFSIQLALSDEPVNPDDVPHLDIFDAYRLYTVAGMHQGDFKHALRMGFFSDTGAAEAVAGYLRCYFEQPAVKRVSNAERERFSQQRMVPKRDIGATGVHTVIELSTAPRVPERRLADISNNVNHRGSDSGSLWSRLVAPLRR